jgi:cytochrome b subunit of formate dehydrogenase
MIRGGSGDKESDVAAGEYHCLTACVLVMWGLDTLICSSSVAVRITGSKLVVTKRNLPRTKVHSTGQCLYYHIIHSSTMAATITGWIFVVMKRYLPQTKVHSTGHRLYYHIPHSSTKPCVDD